METLRFTVYGRTVNEIRLKAWEEMGRTAGLTWVRDGWIVRWDAREMMFTQSGEISTFEAEVTATLKEPLDIPTVTVV